MKTYFIYVRKFSFLTGSYELYVYKTITDNIYRVIGKIFVTTLERIERLDFNLWTPAREQFWIDEGKEIINYKEPHLSEEG